MSIFSDYKVGALSEFEFRQECKRMNRQEYIDDFEQLEMEDPEDDEGDDNE